MIGDDNMKTVLEVAFAMVTYGVTFAWVADYYYKRGVKAGVAASKKCDEM
jgi:hypothetical protein